MAAQANLNYNYYYYVYCFLLSLLLSCSSPSHGSMQQLAHQQISCREQPPFGCHITAAFNSSFFDKDFYFGTATSAYQIEGASGRGLNIWDTFTHRYPEKTTDRSNGDVGTNSTHHFKNDISLMKSMGVNAYRLSIAWSRVLPRGKLSRGVNEKGVVYYNELINELLRNGIQPFVTIFHWDLPQALDDEYGGFVSPKILDDYQDFAELCFQRFGDRVKHWITLNQPYTLPTRAYAMGVDAPGRCSNRKFCDEGDSAKEPYLVAHNLILAHARVVNLYRQKYHHQGGFVGATLITRWFLPYNENSEEDKKAVQRALDFVVGWWMDPFTFGDYPKIMKELVGSRLPNFTAEESRLVKGSLDFLGLNYYFTQYVNSSNPDPETPNAMTDPHVNLSSERDGKPIGPKVANFAYYPKGFKEILTYVKDKYKNPLIYVTENGFSDSSNVTLTETLADRKRIDYHCSHLCFMRSAIENGSRVKGYFVWSLLDNYEFGLGHTVRFGMNYVNFNNLTDRRPKDSAKWFTRFLGATKIGSETLLSAV